LASAVVFCEREIDVRTVLAAAVLNNSYKKTISYNHKRVDYLKTYAPPARVFLQLPHFHIPTACLLILQQNKIIKYE
jgi:hypothetical protein